MERMDKPINKNTQEEYKEQDANKMKMKIKDNKDNTRHKGRMGEELARSFLISRGFNIITSNFYTRYGEIDIIAIKDNILHFIEVKSRANDQPSFDPIRSINEVKLNRIIKSVHMYLEQHDEGLDFCIDVILLRGQALEFIENVTL